MQIKRKIQYRAERRRKVLSGLIFNPSLVLSGAWMIRAGFCVGDQVTVTVDQGLILITY
ncbi:type I addiction module toxin, SymE family [Cytophagaceae bacterium SJW1-29]|uniref:Type I addiction module toxin, SymE family n=2 Tax=Salmonirosea aquatica TaxID=2654236 RepID=A0A7C9BKE8_9BACT|nr:type I addiction module toxin, SymE family [Cytophagaceae bacterium SJW1-29]